MKLFLLAILTLLIDVLVNAQEINNLRIREIPVSADTIRIDSLSIIPGTLQIKGNGRLLEAGEYFVDHAGARIYIKTTRLEKISVSYRVLSLDLSKPFFHKDKNLLNKPGDTVEYHFAAEKKFNRYEYDNSQLKKNGSISRGVSFGNNQDVIVNSNLNLQLSGKLSNDLDIEAAITDNNIPVQPDGNTQQIQEFDKVYISVFNKKNRLTVGDYEIKRPTGNFMQLNKKVQGAMFSTIVPLEKNGVKAFKTTVSGAVAKGKYCRMNITGQEGNQGPYKLKGAENETFIIVLAGSEKIYIDGKLLTRGEENDYVIDYNTGELTFTPNFPVTKDKRIVAEFEYSERSYARFMVYNSNEYITKNSKSWLNIYSEQDARNQPVQQELSDVQKQLLSGIGDSLNLALVPNIDSIGFNNDYVLYKKTDTLVGTDLYTGVFVFSTDPDSAVYRLGFTQLGENKGNYVQVQSSANGKVYRWVAPVLGIPQGSYEPVVLLVTPKKKQMISAGTDYKIGKNTSAGAEIGITNNDLNTFSSLNAEDNTGYAVTLSLKQNIPLRDTLRKMTAGAGYQLINENFEPVERFRNVEFERDWNLSSEKSGEHFLNFNLGYINRNINRAAYKLEWLTKENIFEAWRNNAEFFLDKKGFKIDASGSLLNSTAGLQTTAFARHKASLSKAISFITIGAAESSENNKWNYNGSDSLMNNSFSFFTWELFANNTDTTKSKYYVGYKNRKDLLPLNNQLNDATLGEDFSAGLNLAGSEIHSFRTSINYRNLEIINDSLTTNKPDNNITGRFEYGIRLLKNTISSSTFYETGSGMEVKKEFSYLEVAPGQGVFQWTDYNGNGVKELDEFEVAVFQDQASYIRVFTPTSEYIRTANNQFNQLFNIMPERLWKNKKGVRKILSHFSDQFAYRINSKKISGELMDDLNPFASGLSDTMLMSFGNTVRNTFSLNRTSAVAGLDYIYQANSNRIILTNGADTRRQFFNGLQFRWNVTKKIMVLDKVNRGEKTYESEYFPGKNYEIPYTDNEATLRFQPGNTLRISISHKYSGKSNTLGTEKSVENNMGVEFRYNVLSTSNLSVNFNYILIDYNASAGTPVAYTMLDGLQPGKNATWVVLYQRNLSKSLQMNLTYNGRKSEDLKTVHTGGVQLRAYF